MKHYLDLDFKTGLMYEYSSVKKEGYDEHTNKSGVVSYRKNYKHGVAGTLRSMYVHTKDFGGLEARIMMDQGGDSFMLKLPITTSSGRMDMYMESLVSTLPNMVAGEVYRIFPYAIETERVGKNKQPIMKRGVSVKHAVISEDGKIEVGETVEKALRFLKKDEVWDKEDPTVIPPLEFKEAVGGGMKPTAVSLALKSEFIEDVLQAQIKRLDTSSDYEAANENTPKPEKEEAPVISDDVPKARGASKAPVKKEPAKVLNIIPDTDEDEDDLPF